MMRNRTFHGIAVVLVLALAVPALRAAPPSETQSVEDRLTQVLDQLRDIKARVGNIQANQDLQARSMQDDIDHLKDDMRRLADEVRRLSAARPAIAASINPVPPTASGSGVILLTNNYGYPATVYINNKPFRVEPSAQVRVTDTPVGAFTYSVVTDNGYVAQQPTNRVLAAGRDFPITINP